MLQIAHVVFNPASGSYSPARAERILAGLRRAGMDPQPLLPGSEAAAIGAVRALCDPARPPLIIAVGGDGTINTVINGMTPKGATLGVIPLGTANVLAWELGIRSIEAALQRIAHGRLRPFTVGEATSAEGTRRFLLMAGIGLDAAAVAGVRPAEKARLGKLAYLFAGLRQLRDWDRSLITISDGQRSERCHAVIISNACHYGGPYRLAPGAEIFTPQLEVLPFQFPTRRSFFRAALPLVLAGRAPASAGWQLREGSLTITGAKPVQLDGDSFGSTPLTIRLMPDFNKLLC
ncbi:diacylglycerol/lipid kinase family protein [Trichlorobacter sp.]|uniref:diacylglycerol/lipid kinase family protein n=1 Tax=Trichlorobacter sp. TaxID=2911007 RepID=UPI002A35C419|nr:diacylglycerol kinase family protein [Trichlorobacter sp.]MDY0384781.1 diacylglycerol kinase family protein [Trichlorobacter sp.]